MADFQALQQKYAPVEQTVKDFEPYGAKFVGSELTGEQLHFVATVPSEVVLNRVWDAIKTCDPTFSDLNHDIQNTGGTDQKYTIQAGDNLSKVSELFYGSANHYGKIAEASGIDNPDHIQVGQEVTIPVIA
jgi:nucleoid-associated protein YgaU